MSRWLLFGGPGQVAMKTTTILCAVLIFLAGASAVVAQTDRHSWRPPGDRTLNAWAGSPSYRNYSRGYVYRGPSYYVQPPYYVPYAYGAYYGPSPRMYYAPRPYGLVVPYGAYPYVPAPYYQYQYHYWYGY